MAAKALNLKEKLIKTLRLRGFARKFLNIEKNSKILKFLYKNIASKLINEEKRKIENGCHCDPEASGAAIP
jgi:hypothetical protein